jgi:hypothetical protein
MEHGTAIQKLMLSEPAVVIRPAVAVLRYQSDGAGSSGTGSSLPEGVTVQSPVHSTGVMVREECKSTALGDAVSVII